MGYIDAEKLIAKIERYENTANDAYNPHGEDADFWYGKVVACEDFKTLVTSLQQKQSEVDLEKEANEMWNYVFSELGWDENTRMAITHKEFMALAKIFFELGLKVNNEKEK